jgi:hypothetical protein
MYAFEHEQQHVSDYDDKEVVYDECTHEFIGEGTFVVRLEPGQSPLCDKLDLKVHGFCKRCLQIAQKDRRNLDAIDTLFDTAHQFSVSALLPCDPERPTPECHNAVPDDSEYVAHNNPTMRLIFPEQRGLLIKQITQSWMQTVAGLSAQVAQQVISKCLFSGDCEGCAHVGDLSNDKWLQQINDDVFVNALHSVKHVVDNLARMRPQKRMRII